MGPAFLYGNAVTLGFGGVQLLISIALIALAAVSFNYENGLAQQQAMMYGGGMYGGQMAYGMSGYPQGMPMNGQMYPQQGMQMQPTYNPQQMQQMGQYPQNQMMNQQYGQYGQQPYGGMYGGYNIPKTTGWVATAAMLAVAVVQFVVGAGSIAIALLKMKGDGGTVKPVAYPEQVAYSAQTPAYTQ